MNAFPRSLRFYTLALFGVATSVALVLATSEPAPALAPLLIFGVLVIFAEHRAVVLTGNMLVSASFMISMASVVVFADQGSLLGPMLVGFASGIYLPQLRRDKIGWVVFNSSVMALAHLAAAATYAALPNAQTAPMPAALLGALPPALAYVGASWLLLLVSYAVEGEQSPRDLLTDLLPSALQGLPFALLGVFVGRLYLEVGPSVVVLLIVPVLVAREMFQSYLDVKAANEDTLKVLIRALEAKDRYTAGHSERVAHYARYVGEELRLSPWRLERLRIAALCHDIGKLVVPNQLLNKPGRLTEAEYQRVKLHEEVTVEMMSQVDFLAPVAPTTSFEAGRYQPDDAKHPIEPYIIAVVDAFDAMTSTRSYRRALPQETAFTELRSKAGTQFHPDCVEALIAAIERRSEVHGAGKVEDDVEPFEIAPPRVGVGSAGLGDLVPEPTAPAAS